MDAIDINATRNEFPVTKRMLYLDSAHQTPMATCVRKALDEFNAEGNEMAGPKPVWMRRVEIAREKAALLLNADASEIAFTKNTSEGLNIAANAVPLQRGDTVLLLSGDHPNNAYAWLNLKRRGVNVRFVDVRDDEVADAATFASHIDGTTKVISMSHVTFHAGQVHDIEAIGALCRQRGLYFVVDAMQSVGVLPVDVRKCGISVLAAGTHKGLLVPQGLGLLYVARELQELQPPFVAMSSMARPPADFIANPDDLQTRQDAGRFEIGNYNLPDLHALISALDLIAAVGVDSIRAHVLELGDCLIAGLDELGVRLVGPRQRTGRNHIYVLDVPVREWTEYFSQQQIRVSPERGGVRVSFGMFNTLEDVEQFIAAVAGRLQQGGGTDTAGQLD